MYTCLRRRCPDGALLPICSVFEPGVGEAFLAMTEPDPLSERTAPPAHTPLGGTNTDLAQRRRFVLDTSIQQLVPLILTDDDYGALMYDVGEARARLSGHLALPQARDSLRTNGAAPGSGLIRAHGWPALLRTDRSGTTEATYLVGTSIVHTGQYSDVDSAVRIALPPRSP